MNKRSHAVYELLEDMASNNYNWQIEKGPTIRVVGVHKIDTLSTLIVQMEVLTRKIDKMQNPALHQQVLKHDWCGGGHSSREYMNNQSEEVNVVGYGYKNDPYPNTYNPG